MQLDGIGFAQLFIGAMSIVSVKVLLEIVIELTASFFFP